MTYTNAAAELRELAEACDRLALMLPADLETGAPVPMLTGDAAVGAAALLCFIRDLLTGAPKDVYTREELLVLLETMTRNGEMFPCGVAQVMWAAEECFDGGLD